MTQQPVIHYNPSVIRKQVLWYTAQPNPADYHRQGAVIGALEAVLNTSVQDGETVADLRRLVLGWIFTPDDQPLRPMHAKEISAQGWFGLRCWQTTTDTRGGHVGRGEFLRAAFAAECRWMLHRARQDLAATEREPELQFGILVGKWHKLNPERSVSVYPDTPLSTLLEMDGVLTDRQE